MPKETMNGEDKESVRRNGARAVKPSDLIELILEPLSDQIDRARQEILEKVHGIDESLHIIARQKRRELPE